MYGSTPFAEHRGCRWEVYHHEFCAGPTDARRLSVFLTEFTKCQNNVYSKLATKVTGPGAAYDEGARLIATSSRSARRSLQNSACNLEGGRAEGVATMA